MHRFVKYGSTLPAFLTFSMSVSMAHANQQLKPKTASTSARTSVFILCFDSWAFKWSRAGMPRLGCRLAPEAPSTGGCLGFFRGGSSGATPARLPEPSARYRLTNYGLHPVPKWRIKAPVGFRTHITTMNNGRNGNHLAELERRLWAAADQLWANSSLRPSEYSAPVLGLIFLRFVDNSFTKVEAELKGKATGRRTVGKLDYQAKGVMYLPDAARFSRLLNAPEGADTGKLLNEAMKAVERENEDLKDVLPKTYQRIDNPVLVELLKIMSGIPAQTLPIISLTRAAERWNKDLRLSGARLTLASTILSFPRTATYSFRFPGTEPESPKTRPSLTSAGSPRERGIWIVGTKVATSFPARFMSRNSPAVTTRCGGVESWTSRLSGS